MGSWTLLLVSFFFISLIENVAPVAGSTYEYDADVFKLQIKELDGNFIMFYAPWCRHCTEFEPIWIELGELINTKDSQFAIAQVDCTKYHKLCHDNDITGYPTLLYFHKNSFTPIEYKGTRDLPSLTLFLSEVFTMKEEIKQEKPDKEVKVYSGMAHLNDHNIEKFISSGQHFIMFYAPWCGASQMGVAVEMYTLDELKEYVQKMLLAENHDPEKFMKKKKVLPVARITEETFETFLQKDLVFVNYFAPWCAHCMQLNPLWLKLGEKFQNESRVLIADVDCVRSKTVCEMEKINGLPTLILYKNKEIVSLENGGQPFESLVTLVNEHLDDKSLDVKEDEKNLQSEAGPLKKDVTDKTKPDIKDRTSENDISGSDEIIIQNELTDEDKIIVKDKNTKDEL
ncbi:thioredoxin domain-containing protein 5 homolog isoform X2 [Pieris brassicae]|uniref:thioredoxin domain-containing protein 5 homolog isoform X2 n=1 Tax=Pieris brassicae TaxID=7116 RepID=UPI001E65FA1B|nr:thioredoxin domain-containing protein 5 homolog isoform X2 [Pieris brassicae]